MTPHVLIAGTGKMGRSIGLYLLKRGLQVTWLCRTPERRQAFTETLRKDTARLARIDPEFDPARGGVRLAGEAAEVRPDAAVETTAESIGVKREAVHCLLALCGPDAVAFTNSSSILPSRIHPRCIGMHFFYPPDLTGVVEIIVPPGCPPRTRDFAQKLAADWGLQSIVEDESHAFAANRLLLPIQAECFRAVASGCPPRYVDAASVNPLLPVGQLSLIDNVGIDIVAPSVANYVRRMRPAEATAYGPLESGLARLLAMGKKGNKNRDGFLSGNPLPWHVDHGTDGGELLHQRLLYLAVNSCYRAAEQSQPDEGALEMLLANVFGAEDTPEGVLRSEGVDRVHALLTDCWRRTGTAYWRPAARLSEG